MDIRLQEGGINVVIRVMDDGDVLLVHFSPLPFDEALIPPHTLRGHRLLQLQAAGWDQNDHHGNKHTGCQPGLRLRYQSHAITQEPMGTRLTVTLAGDGLEADCVWQFCPAAHAVRTHTQVRCIQEEGVCLTYVSAFALTGLNKGAASPDTSGLVSYALNSWCSELQWRRQSLCDLGLTPISCAERLHRADEYQNFSLQSFSPCGRGTWPSSEYLPMGAFEDTQQHTAMAWQIEAGGPWQWEISTFGGEYYLLCSGPDDERHHWRMSLKQGESYTSPTAAVVALTGTREDALAALTLYRRAILRPCSDTRTLPVIFNDYMALLGDPTEEKLLPLIDEAARLGGEYFCVDSGWYAEGNWWDSVGQWLPADRRFPHGLGYVMQAIRDRGMIPGLWLEIEVMGVNCPLASQWPDERFFMRHGRRVIDHGRYQLDFSHPDVRRYADEVVDRLVREYGVGYIKIDYNINAGYGTHTQGRNAGQGLEQHLRAYRAWLADVLQRYPDLVIENCASGGMRMEYGMLSLLPVQSLSDQDEMLRLAPIACAAPSAVTPEQAACWSLPKAADDGETMAFCMINAMLGRIHQSGELQSLRRQSRALLQEAIALYKTYRMQLPQAKPFWPLGLPAPGDTLLALGMDFGAYCLLAVWQLGYDGDEASIPLPRSFQSAHTFYPVSLGGECRLNEGGAVLSARMPQSICARLYRLQ